MHIICSGLLNYVTVHSTQTNTGIGKNLCFGTLPVTGLSHCHSCNSTYQQNKLQQKSFLDTCKTRANPDVGGIPDESFPLPFK